MIAKACSVHFMGLEVGSLAYINADSPYASFEYSKEWIADGFSISPIHMPLSQALYTFPALSANTFRGLPSAFADSLPDDFGNALIDAWLAQTGRDKNQFSAIDRLLYTGTRGMGALEYQHALEPFTDTHNALSVSELLALAQDVLDNRNSLSINSESDDAINHLFQVGTSAGGARPKAVIAMDSQRKKIISGQGNVPDGFEHYLLKFDGVEEHNSGRETFGDPKGFGVMEYAYYKMATACGITMSRCELLEESGRRHFMTRRFDREGGQKYHVLTLCAMAHADYKKPGQYSYEEVLSVARTLSLSQPEQIEIFRRMVFNVVARNHDDHTKNTAFFVDDNFKWRLSPAYDIAYSYKPGSAWVDRHQMSINGKRDNFTRSDLLTVAALITSLSNKEACAIIERVIGVASNWMTYAKECNVFPEFRELIQENLRLHL